MDSYVRRRVKKRHDLLPILLLLVSLVLLPVLGFVGWKVLKQKPVMATTRAVKTEAPADYPPVAKQESGNSSGGHFSYGSGGAENFVVDKQNFHTPGEEYRSNRGGRDNSHASSGLSLDSSGAIDQIANSLTEALGLPKKVLVVWLFDETASAESLRRDVMGQMQPMYRRLADAAKSATGGDPPVLSLVGQFGDKLNFLTPEPVATFDDVQTAVGQIKDGAGHVENTFAAVDAALEKVIDYRKKKGRYVTIVVVTDEAADDRANIDKVLPKLTPYGIPVQAIGPSALFAEMEGQMRNAEGSPPPGEVWVIQGPDSHDPDWIKLDFPNGGSDYLDIETGVGTYELARLCRETDGEFFALGHRAQAGGLKGFDPQYMSEKEYADRLQANKAKKALVEAAKLPRAAVQSHMTQTFSETDDVKRARALESAQKPVAKVMPAIDALYNALKAGEADLPKLAGTNDKRWRAAFEVAIGRAGAARVRHQGYIEMTAQMKAGRKFQDEKHDTWVLERTDDPMGISALDKTAAKSREYLKHVVQEYPDTPWAKSAERELAEPMSYKWVEK
ncbi:MAG TPA: vWA domain-containing protein [Pirellulales bacterium]|jgi:hypothetical protein|nr:vWA domain-containing protein [Pirellulales bacterium]